MKRSTLRTGSLSMFLKQKNHSTVNFLQWYVAEQHEKEHEIQQVLDKIHNIGEAGGWVYFIDQAIGGMVHKNWAD